MDSLNITIINLIGHIKKYLLLIVSVFIASILLILISVISGLVMILILTCVILFLITNLVLHLSGADEYLKLIH